VQIFKGCEMEFIIILTEFISIMYPHSIPITKETKYE
jgi:hypothetical protein